MHYFQMKGKLKAKYAFLLKKKTKLICNPDIFFIFIIIIIITGPENRKSTVQKSFLYLRKVLFLNSSNFSLIVIIAFSFVFKNIYSAHSKSHIIIKTRNT